MPELGEPKFATRVELATRYRVGLRTLDRWLSEGRLPKVRLGKRCVRLPIAECDAALQKFLISEVTR
jgi:excisionase family DNA binding protein